MRSAIAFFVALVFLISGCTSNTPTPVASQEDQMEQLRRIASDDADFEEVVDDETTPPTREEMSTDDNAEVFRANRGAPWEHDPGPDMKTPVGRRFAELFANTPNYRSIGQFMLSRGPKDRSEKFRWQFGPMFYRGRTGENQVKVLIIGQEGAQDENVSDRSFTGGTGGRMQNMLSFMGIDRSYLFVNTFVYTIQGQYADFAPMLIDGQLQWRNLLTPQMLAMAQDERSPIVKHRHAVLDHVIAANRNSLRMIIAVGGAAQDSLATYIQSKGGRCQTSVSEPQRIQAVAYGSASAGGNKRFFFPVDGRGKNLLADIDFREPNYKDKRAQNAAKDRARSPEVMKRLVRRTDGPMRNGLLDLKQTTMRLETCQNRAGAIGTLGGLDGVDRDIRFIGVQHPGSNSPTLEAKFTKALNVVKSWQGRDGWVLQPDCDAQGRCMQQPFDQGFRYTHKPVPRRDFRFGLADVIGMGNTSTTRRNGGEAIEFGGRESGQYRNVADAYNPSQQYQETDLPNEPPKSNFGAYDPGPNEKWARTFIEKLPVGDLVKVNKATQPKFGAWGIYRGRLENSEVLVLADQTSHDDVWVGRAMMGFEGQRLQAFLGSIGAGLNYTILRTLPVDTLGASPMNIKQLLDISRNWRNNNIAEVLQNNPVKVILTLGPQAENEIRSAPVGNIPVISLTGPDGYKRGFEQMRNSPWAANHQMRFDINPIPIAREDIPYGMRRWTGTSGDRVLRTESRGSAGLYLIRAPGWAVKGPAAAPKPLSQQDGNYLGSLRPKMQ